MSRVGEVIIGIAVLLIFQATQAAITNQDSQELKTFLTRFHQNPSSVMGEHPITKDMTGAIVTGDSRFSESEIQSGEYLEARDALRSQFCKLKNGFRYCLKDVLPGRSAPTGDENVDSLFDGQALIKSLPQMEVQGILKGEPDIKPWSESYWPYTKGVIGHRYGDRGFPNSKDWSTNFAYINLNSASGIYSSGGNIDILAPSEKYDMMIGANSLPLTQQMWALGKAYYDQFKSVSGWMGICHGWAGAAITYPEPVKAISVGSVGGRTMTLYPSDVKALQSVMWATAVPPVHFIGGRCKTKNPPRDAMGRIIPVAVGDGKPDTSCVDINPGTWHVAVVNQMGVNRRSFVMDGTYDFEVWNFPLRAYEYIYFNPQSLEPATHWRGAMIPMDRYTMDKFRDYRNPAAAGVVGVMMKVTYMTETAPNHLQQPNDSHKTVNYVYDLEVDAAGGILGGEWYSNIHPDFLWSAPPGSHAVSIGDSAINPADWNGVDAIPASWVSPGQQAASIGQALAGIVDKLTELAK